MTSPDRKYTYVAKTFDAPAIGLAGFEAALRESVLPAWQHARAAGTVKSVQTLRKLGDVDLQTAAAPVRDWEYFVLAELEEGAEPAQLLEAERAAGLDAGRLASRGVEYLSNEILVRPASAGTAIPTPSPRFAAPPLSQQAAIEYIQIPPAHWDDYHRFMKEVMGPVGAQMVRVGHSYQVQILERSDVLHRDASLPQWNRIHVLWGEFDDPANGFFKHTNLAIREVLDAQLDVQQALQPVNRYRIKPRMSKNRRVEALCI